MISVFRTSNIVLFSCLFFDLYDGYLGLSQESERDEHTAYSAADKKRDPASVKNSVDDFSSRQPVFSYNVDLDPEREAELTSVDMT